MDEKKNNKPILALIGDYDDVYRYSSHNKMQDVLTDELKRRDEKYDILLNNVKDEDLKFKTTLDDLRGREQDIFALRAFACGVYNNMPTQYLSSKLYLDELYKLEENKDSMKKIDKSSENNQKTKESELKKSVGDKGKDVMNKEEEKVKNDAGQTVPNKDICRENDVEKTTVGEDVVNIDKSVRNPLEKDGSTKSNVSEENKIVN